MRVVFEDPGRELGDETRGLAGGFARAPRAERFLIQQHNISGQDNRFVGPARFCYPPTRMKHCQLYVVTTSGMLLERSPGCPAKQADMSTIRQTVCNQIDEPGPVIHYLGIVPKLNATCSLGDLRISERRTCLANKGARDSLFQVRL